MKTKKLFRKISEKVSKSNFTKEDYEMSKTAIEIETNYFTNSDYDVYIHRYHNSVRFYIQDKLSKEECLFEVWCDRYRVDRTFKNSNMTKFFDKIFQKTIGYINVI